MQASKLDADSYQRKTIDYSGYHIRAEREMGGMLAHWSAGVVLPSGRMHQFAGGTVKIVNDETLESQVNKAFRAAALKLDPEITRQLGLD